MKFWKRAAVFALAACMCVPVFGACNRGENYDNMTQLDIGVYDGGLGTDWINQVARNFEARYEGVSLETGKTGVHVNIVPKKDPYLSGTLLPNIQSGVETMDIYYTSQSDLSVWTDGGVAYDITDILTEKVYAEDGVPENELEGVVYANWQPGDSANGLVMNLSNWQEKKWFDDVTIDFDVAKMVENAGENARLPKLSQSQLPQHLEYLWQPGDADVPLPYGGLSICNAGWENGVLQMVMKGPVNQNISYPENWYFVDTRTDTIIYPESRAMFYTPGTLDPSITDTDWNYIWEFVLVDKEALPYLELHWGGKYIFTTVLPGHWKVTLDETPVTVQSEVLAEDMPLTYGGEELTAERIECSKLSMAVYFADYVDSTTGILSAFKAFDEDGKPIPCDWSFIADQTDDSCMIWTRFNEPIEPERICKLTFNGETVFTR